MFLAVFGFGISFLLGGLYPRRMGWLVLITFPLLYAMYAVIIPSGFFPLTIIRFAFAVTIGILFSNLKKDLPLSFLTKSRVVNLLIVFVIYILFIRGNESLMAFFGSYLPGFFISITLPFLLIQTRHDLQKMVKIFAWQGAVIGFFVVVEYVSEYNPYDFFLSVNQNMGAMNYEEVLLFRGGFKRVSGLAGNAVDTGYLLALYFPISIWLLLSKKIINMIPILLITIGIILIQTRATFIAIGFTLPVMFFFITKYNKGNLKYAQLLIGRLLSISFIAITLGIIMFPGVFTLLSTFFSSMFGEVGGYGVESKVNRIPVAIGYFIAKPMGYGSPAYAYFVLMNSDDLPAPIIYFLAGGFLLGIIYLLLLSNLVYSIFKLLKLPYIMDQEKVFLIMMGCGLLAAVIVVFSNWREKHFLTAFMLYIAIFKIYYLKSINKATSLENRKKTNIIV